MSDNTRQELADRQRAIVAALLEKGPIPPGFDGDAMACASRSLASKRWKDERKREQQQVRQRARPARWFRRLFRR